MKGNVISIGENELRQIIRESIYGMVGENAEEEDWFGDKWNQAKSAYQTATQNGGDGMSLRDRFNLARKNWDTQGDLNNLNNLRQQLQDLVDNRKIDPNTTIAQLLGGKYASGRFGRMSGMINNRRSQIAKHGGQAY